MNLLIYALTNRANTIVYALLVRAYINKSVVDLLVRAYINKSVVLGLNPDLGNLCTLMYASILWS